MINYKNIFKIFFHSNESVRLRYVFSFLIFLFGILTLSSQTYPVQLSTQLVPPYSGYLPDYADPTSEKLKVILQFNDFSQVQYNVKLKFEIKGNGFTISTKTFYNPPPITLIPGQPLLLNSADLAPYLNTNNLDFVGINQSQYQQKMSLPEGYYSICVKAFDYYNNNPIQLSNEACAQAWFTLSDPPYLNLPLCNTVVTPLTPQNMLFQWTPVNMASPNSAFNTEYEFALYECRPDSNANPNQIVLSTAPIFSTITQQTFLNYGLTETPLNLYMKYVWRVRAKDFTGRDLFKNNGYSQICTFTYGSIKTVFGNSINLNLKARAINHRTGECVFTKNSVYNNYLLQVKKLGTNSWFNYPNISGIERIPNLEPSTTYECRVRGEGNNLIGEWTNIESFKTNDPPTYTCNDNTLPVNNNAQPLPQEKAVIGMIIQSGQFEVVSTEIESTGQPGWYKGKGYALVFGGLPVAVKWDNIFIDSEQRQQQGIIEALTKGIDKWLNDYDIKEAEENATYVDGEIDTIFVSGKEICYTTVGKSTTTCVATPTNMNVMVIRDSEGNQYTIDLVPPPPKIKGPTNYLNYSDDNLDASDSIKVVFEASISQSFGFDGIENAAFIDNYEAIKLGSGKPYFVPNKSIGETSTDEVMATYTISGIPNPQISFKTQNGIAISATSQNGKYKLTGILANANCVYAYYNNQKIGKLNVISLKAISKKLVLVSVNGANVNLNASDLNAIYKQANVSWSVSTGPPITFNLGADGLEAADATLLSKYSTEMRALRDAYITKDSAYDKQAYYLFVVPNFTDANLAGYMVRGRALGFVKAAATAKEIAHELAHGAFGLEHTFPKAKEKTTSNLLDYGTGSDLVKEQWVVVQNPGIILSWNDEEEAASLLGKTPCSIDSLPSSPIEIRLFHTKAYNCADDVADKVAEFVRYYGPPANNHFKFFCVDTRVKLIKCLLNGLVTREDEDAIFALLESTPEKDIPGLKAYLSCLNYQLYLQLENEFNDAGIGQKSYTKLVKILCDLIGKNPSAVAIDNVVKNDLVFEFKQNSLSSITDFKSEDAFTVETKGNYEIYHRSYYTYHFNKISDTKLSLDQHKHKTTITDGGGQFGTGSYSGTDVIKSKGKEYELFDLIAVIPRSAPTYNDYSFPDGEMRVLPALYFKWLDKKNYNEEIENIGYGIAGVVSMATGFGELALAIKAGNALKLILPAAEVFFGATSIADASSNGGFSNFLQQNLSPAQYKAFRSVEATINVIALYKAGRANFINLKPKLISNTQDFYDKLKAAPQFFKDLKTKFPEKYNKLKEYFQKAIGKNIDEVGNSGGILSKFFNKGFSFEDIVKEFNSTFNELGKRISGKVVRPYSEYLDNKHVSDHKNLFQQQGAGFIVVRSWTEDGRFLTMPPRKFVGLQSEMDAVVSKYKARGNDWTILRDELNLGSTANLATEEIYYIKIDGNDSRFSFDIPTGNEGGAIPGEWVPGGYTKSGTAEAALVGSEKITHNKDINQLLNHFKGKWEKIK